MSFFKETVNKIGSDNLKNIDSPLSSHFLKHHLSWIQTEAEELGTRSFHSPYLEQLANSLTIPSEISFLHSVNPLNPIGKMKRWNSETFEPDAQSDYHITANGVVEEQWDVIHNIQARLVEVNESTIVLECLVDSQSGRIENRVYERDSFEGIIPFKMYAPVIIKIFKRAGTTTFKFIDGKNLIDDSVFDQDYFGDIDKSIFERKF